MRGSTAKAAFTALGVEAGLAGGGSFGLTAVAGRVGVCGFATCGFATGAGGAACATTWCGRAGGRFAAGAFIAGGLAAAFVG